MKRSAQVKLTLMVGTEMWLRVEHARGWFKLPADARAEDILRGALLGWSGEQRSKRYASGSVRIPLDVYLEATLTAVRAEPPEQV